MSLDSEHDGRLFFVGVIAAIAIWVVAILIVRWLL